MSTPRLTPEVEEALRAAREMALEAGHDEVMPRHLAAVLVQDKGILRQAIVHVSGGNNRPADTLRQVLSTDLDNKKTDDQKGQKKTPKNSPTLDKAIKSAGTAQKKSRGGTPLGLWQLALSLHSDKQIVKYYTKADVPIDQVRVELKMQVALEMYGHDLVAQARAGELNAVNCRSKEIHRVANILSILNNKNNAILVGKPGVGKTAIVQGLALHIAKGGSSSLKGARLIELNMDRLVDEDECQKRLRDVLKEVEKAQGKVILFIKDIHSVPGVGTTDGSINSPNLMKPLLHGLGTVRHLQCIGSTTPEKYLKYIDKDSANFNRHFEMVEVRELSVEHTIDVLRGRKENLECDYGVRITDSALETAARLASRYIRTGRCLPDKAIALVHKACASVRGQVENRPLEMDELEDEKTRLEAELRSLVNDKAKKARRREVKEQLREVRAKLGGQMMEYDHQKDWIRKYNEWCQEAQSRLPDAARRKLSPSMLNSMKNPVETAIFIAQREIRKYKKEKMVLSFEEENLKEEVNEADEESKARWQKRKVELDDERQALDRAIKRWKDFKKRCESTKGYEDWVQDRTVDKEKIGEEVSRETKIPVRKLGQDEEVKLLELADKLNKRVFGQTKAVEAIVNAIMASKAHSDKQRQRPIGSFLFMGPTGVGKTELAKALAEQLFDDEEQLIRVDMSEYMEEHSVSRLIGAPPGYEGHDDGGALTNKVWSKPYSLVLLDEIEKAHPQVLNILLQVLDYGRLTDGKGKTVDFTNTVIIMTSNLSPETVNEKFSLELQSRINKTVTFDRLPDELLGKIARHHIKAMQGCFPSLTLAVTDAAVDFIVEQPDVQTYGARKLIRTWIEEDMTARLVRMKLKGEIVKNCIVHIDAVSVDGKNELAYKVETRDELVNDENPSTHESIPKEDKDTRNKKRTRADGQPQEYSYMLGLPFETEVSEQAIENRSEAREAAVRSLTTDSEDDGPGAGSSPGEASRPKRVRKPNSKVTGPGAGSSSREPKRARRPNPKVTGPK